jgi:hypothetical protein
MDNKPQEHSCCHFLNPLAYPSHVCLDIKDFWHGSGHIVYLIDSNLSIHWHIHLILQVSHAKVHWRSELGVQYKGRRKKEWGRKKFEGARGKRKTTGIMKHS